MAGLDNLPFHRHSHSRGGSDPVLERWSFFQPVAPAVEDDFVDEDPVTADFEGPWLNISDAEQPSAFRLVLGELQLRLAVTGDEDNPGSLVATLPTGYWPTRTFRLIAALGDDSLGVFEVSKDDGTIIYNGRAEVAATTALVDLTDVSGAPGNGYAPVWNGSAFVFVNIATQTELDAVETEITNHIADTTDAHDASAISIVDAGSHYTSTDVEGALQEAATAAGSGAPASASYVTTQAESGLSAEAVLGTAVIMAGLNSARPSASIAGRLYLSTDVNGGTLYRDTGSAWVQVAAGVSAGGAPSSASYVTYAAEAGLSAEAVLGGDVIMRGTAASRPAAAVAGKLWVSTDVGGGTLYRDNGASWDQIAPGITDAAPSAASYVTVNSESGLSGEFRLGGDVIMRGTHASRPAASKEGLLYAESDVAGGTLFRDSGSAWQQVAAGATEVTDHLADTSDAHDASAISIVDTGNYFTGTDVEAALQQIGSGSGGALGGRLIKLADTTLGSPAGSIDLTSLSTSYAHMVIYAYLRCTTVATTQDCFLRFNNDSGSNYDAQFLNGNGTAASAAQDLGQTRVQINEVPAASATANTFGIAIIELVNYANGSNNTVGWIRNGRKLGTSSGNLRIFNAVFWYRSNTAVSRVTIVPGANNLDTGSRVSIFALDAS